jgi:hypothetical protein
MFQARTRLWFVLGVAVAALANGGSQPSESSALDQDRGFLFAGASARLLTDSHFSRDAVGELWDPTSDEISALEKVLANDLRASLIERQRPSDDGPLVHDYFRQYAGIHVNGRKLIFINGFHKSHVEDTVRWLSETHTESALKSFPKGARNEMFWHFVPVHVMDGGEFYFQAYYDPLSRRLVWFRFQGYA